ncbi:unnamed protein product [Protopolystoma xenopodis]|uniref:Uncharacterized protein n=1 Tax=Protopolystoma xenopodis TaxID=117903 RepID=A0A3S5B1Q5_9PLAT|nr:unnamed protein product [Protopolystoma xenopodis]
MNLAILSYQTLTICLLFMVQDCFELDNISFGDFPFMMRPFKIQVTCYVYFTRIVVYLLCITIPFWSAWVVELFKESVMLAFCVAVGVKFRPIDDNPYLQLGSEDEESDPGEDTLMECIQIESAAITTQS